MFSHIPGHRPIRPYSWHCCGERYGAGYVTGSGRAFDPWGRPNLSGKWFNAVQYGVSRETGQIDYDALEAKAMECQPKLIVAGASAYPRQLDFAAFRRIADKVGALLMVDMAHISGLVATGFTPALFPMPLSSPLLPTKPCAPRGAGLS